MRPLLALLFLATSGPAAEIRIYAGGLGKGFTGDGGPATKAQFHEVNGVVRGPDGALYVCDTKNHRIRRIAADGTVSTFAGSGTAGFAGDGGPAIAAALNEPYEVRFDAVGNCYFVERLNHCVRKVDAKSGVISTVAGTGGKAGFGGDGGPATAALLAEPHSIGFDRSGDLYICDIRNHRVRKVAMKTGVISTFAGTGERAATPDGAKISGTPVNGPRTLDFDRDGNLWLALREGNAIYKLDLRAGTIHHVAGVGGKPGFAGNGGPAKEAALAGPKGISVGPDGNVYFADTESHSIRYIDTKKGTVELLAGTGTKGNGPDGHQPAKCQLARPHGIFVDSDGSVFIGDTDNDCVRVIRRQRERNSASNSAYEVKPCASSQARAFW
jgi:streptogramin lyase